ncbi:hypothetical protein AOLI_G00306130 [Acnodon oligacanthus]
MRLRPLKSGCWPESLQALMMSSPSLEGPNKNCIPGHRGPSSTMGPYAQVGQYHPHHRVPEAPARCSELKPRLCSVARVRCEAAAAVCAAR